MGKKLLVSLAMEGKFSEEGLQALGDGEDMLTAMARELVTERGIGEQADVVWRQIQAEQNRIVPAMTHDPEPVESPAGTTPETCVPIPQNPTPSLASLLTFGSQPSEPRPLPRKKRSNPISEQQLALF
jgi:hypothetical protein